MTVGVLFVCAGNICRSPMAEAVFQQLVNEQGLAGQFMLDSAGTGGWHVGQQADSRTLAVLRHHNIAYHGHARQATRQDFETFDYVLAMDHDNLSDVQRLGGRRRNVELFLAAAQRANVLKQAEVPDPYYDGTFDRVYNLCLRGGAALLAEIREDHGF
ncbi:MAG: low molecular weight phosphotyrosine protein phosphatase [Anaerolineae bacterium]|nr:low molecular weight phosphotyrosine protein phosphatase [Anaerolineae bacterium]